MRVAVAFRGGVGDWWLWMVKIPALLRFHKDDEVILAICSPWPEAMMAWSGQLRGRQFDETHILKPYTRPIAADHMEKMMVGRDLVYHLDVWKGPRGASAIDHPMCPVESVHPHLKVDWHPTLKIKQDGVGGTVIQVEGNAVGAVCEPEWWRAGLEEFPKPVRLLGRSVMEPSAYGASANLTDPLEIYAAIQSAEVMVGVDSGFRNVAFTTRTPVVEIRKIGLGLPDYDVFVPEPYRSRMLFLDLDPPPLSSMLGPLKELVRG